MESTPSRWTRRPRRSYRLLVGLAFDLDPFYAWAAGEDVLQRLVPPLAGFRPPLVPDPFEMLVGAITAQQVSLLLRDRDPEPADRALRRTGRLRVVVSFA